LLGSSVYSASVTTGPLRGSHDTYVAHGENEFDTPALNQGAFTPEAKIFLRATKSHEKSTYRRVSERCVWGDAMWPTRLQRRVFSGAIFASRR